jgi:hypothetical protein
MFQRADQYKQLTEDLFNCINTWCYYHASLLFFAPQI